MNISDSFLRRSAIALGISGGLLFVFGSALFPAGTFIGLGIFGLGMVANGALGLRTGRISFARRGRKDTYEGPTAKTMAVGSAALGLLLVLVCCAVLVARP